MPSWWDRFGEEWASSGLTDDPTFAQGDAGWAFIGQAPPTVEQFNSMFQWSDNKDNWLYGQIANCIIGSGVEPASNDLMQLWNAIKSLQRRKLAQDTAFYVDSINGNDLTGDGTPGKPWSSPQHAIYYIYNNVDCAGHAAIIQLAPGTYTSVYHYQQINGYLILQGDPNNPRAYLISNPNGSAIGVDRAGTLYVTGIAVEAQGISADYGSFGVGINSWNGGILIYEKIAYGPCTYCHCQAGLSAQLWPWNGASSQYLIYGGSQYHSLGSYNGVITTVRVTVTITGNPNFSQAYTAATGGGLIQIWNQITNGGCTGRKYACTWGGYIAAAGQANTVIPGTIAGLVDSASFAIVS